MENYQTVYLPQFTIGADAFDNFGKEMQPYGNTVAVIYGKQAWQASVGYILPALRSAGLRVVCEQPYGVEATMENMRKLEENEDIWQADMILAVGGGKCIDTVKLAAAHLNKPVFTVPTIASNCASVTKLSVMYNPDGSFLEVMFYPRPPIHCFIHPGIILKAPAKYLWAGIGDAIAKNVECEFSAKNDIYLNYSTMLGKTVSQLCFEPLLRYGKQALADAEHNEITPALTDTIFNVIVAPGITSITVDRDYNEAVAHALFYGLASRKDVEQNHLHGEIVAYGTLVNLMLDHDMEKLKALWLFNQSLGLPTRLVHLGLSVEDSFEDVMPIALARNGMKHLPYPVTPEQIRQSISELEQYQA